MAIENIQQLRNLRAEIPADSELNPDAIKEWGGFMLDVLNDGIEGGLWGERCPEMYVTSQSALQFQPLRSPDGGKTGFLNINYISGHPLSLQEFGFSKGYILIETRLDETGRHKVKQVDIQTYDQRWDRSTMVDMVTEVVCAALSSQQTA